MKTAGSSFALIVLLGVCSPVGAGQKTVSRDVGLITHIQGQVDWQSATTGKLASATPFMKVRIGDGLQLKKGAVLRLIYFKSGRHETWQGPAHFSVTAQASKSKDKNKPKVVKLPARSSRDVRRIPDLMRSRLAITRSGSGLHRGAGDAPAGPVVLSEAEREEIAAARQIYTDLRKKVPAGDITPELYLMSVLDSMEQYQEAIKVAQKALKHQPENEYLTKIIEELNKRAQPHQEADGK